MSRRLLEAPYRFSFFQAVQFLEKLAGARARVGYEGPPAEEVIRFRPALSFAFPNADINGIEAMEDPDGRRRYAMEMTFLGLYGTVSPMPSYLTEELLHESGEDSLVRGVLDLFHHRFYSLFFRCWEKYRYYVQFRPEAADEFSRRMLCLIALGIARPPKDSAVPVVRLIRYSGLLNRRPSSAAAVRCVVSDYFDSVPTDVTACVARWVTIPRERRCRLGVANTRLGVDLQAGEQVLDRSGKFRVSMGPLGLDPFVGFLPGERNYRAVNELVRLVASDRLQFEVELIIRKEEIPELYLREDSLGARLGQTSWLGRPPEDARVVFQEPDRVALA